MFTQAFLASKKIQQASTQKKFQLSAKKSKLDKEADRHARCGVGQKVGLPSANQGHSRKLSSSLASESGREHQKKKTTHTHTSNEEEEEEDGGDGNEDEEEVLVVDEHTLSFPGEKNTNKRPQVNDSVIQAQRKIAKKARQQMKNEGNTQLLDYMMARDREGKAQDEAITKLLLGMEEDAKFERYEKIKKLMEDENKTVADLNSLQLRWLRME